MADSGYASSPSVSGIEGLLVSLALTGIDLIGSDRKIIHPGLPGSAKISR
jgi:hypothetical protein